MSAETPVPLVAGGRQVVHFVPLSAFDAGVNVDLKRVLSDRGLFITTTNRGGSLRHNVDGLLAYSQSDGAYDAYAQFFRNGALEIVVHGSKWAARTGELVLPSLSFEEEIFAQAKAALRVLAMAGVTMPVVMMLSFVGIKGWEMGVKDSLGYSRKDRRIRPRSALNSGVAPSSRRGGGLPQLIKPLMDATWNAAGYSQSDHYDFRW